MCDICLCSFTFPLGVLGTAWYFIVSIPDICLLSYFEEGIFRKNCVKLYHFFKNNFEFSYFGTQALLRMHIITG